MAESKTTGASKRHIKRVSYVHLQKLFAAVSLLALFVVAATGVMANVGVVTIAMRALLVIIVIGVIGRLVVQILATYEEMNSGQT
ncbi:MAG: hypothetical protein K1X83_14750 [Oligoflexia bacterium]|nr:hypothetical protein [Oligoflexia bacterium]